MIECLLTPTRKTTNLRRTANTIDTCYARQVKCKFSDAMVFDYLCNLATSDEGMIDVGRPAYNYVLCVSPHTERTCIMNAAFNTLIYKYA